MKYVFCIFIILIWLYFLHLFKKSKLYFWRFLVGSLGIFGLTVYFLFPVLTDPLARSVAALAGIFGDLTGWCKAYFHFGIVFIQTGKESLSMIIDMECSGIIEISAFLSLLAFFDVYSKSEKAVIGILGFLWIELMNALRIILIVAIVHLFGMSAYYVAHTFIGRIFFYMMSIILYFYVFTKPQIIRMKVGNIVYGHNKPNA